MKAECKRLFYKAWKAELPDSQLSMKFPTNFTSYKWTETRALARVFCGRSPTDSGPYKSPSQCEQCNTDAGSEHYLTTCPRFKRARKQLGIYWKCKLLIIHRRARGGEERRSFLFLFYKS
jgi:hypothetical protein